jgi:hypothetical protein
MAIGPELAEGQATHENTRRACGTGRMDQATPCERVLTIEASHSAYFSQPDQLTKQILVTGDDWVDADTEARAPIRPPLGA